MVVAGFVLGLVSATLALFGGWIGLFASVPAIVFSSIAIAKKENKNMAVAGLAFGTITTIYFTSVFVQSTVALIQEIMTMI